jgi:carbonic anhydrase
MGAGHMKKLTIGFVGGLAVGAAAFALSPKAQFVAGGAMANAAYRMQDHIKEYDLEHKDATPEQIWTEFKAQNEMAAKVRETFPRSTYHPLVAMIVCMDARIDTNELTGDTRRNYYIVRTAGSAMSAKEEEMLELAVNNGVKLLVLTTHTDCAAEKAAANPESRAKFPALVQAVDEREARVNEFLARPLIAERIKEGKLLVKRLVIDTASDKLLDPKDVPQHAAAPVAEAHGGEHGEEHGH